MARLVIFDETVRGVDLPAHAVIVGRSRKVDVPIHDRLLSRKHCTILPSGEPQVGSARSEEVRGSLRFRVIDLKSANGTFVNGGRVDKCDLEFDDVIEIGNTVMVLLDTETWNRGEGIARLRNPLKAQELIQRLNRLAGKRSEEGHVLPSSVPANSLKAAGLRCEDDFFRWAEEELPGQPVIEDLLVDYIEQQVVQLLVRASPRVREVLSLTLGRVLTPAVFQGDLSQLRAEIRKALQDVAQRELAAAAGTEEPTGATGETAAGEAEGGAGEDGKAGGGGGETAVGQPVKEAESEPRGPRGPLPLEEGATP